MTCAAPHTPRDQWIAHPHYPSQILLLGSHESFRRVSERVIELAATGRDGAAAESLFLRWMAAMRSHEAYEEHKLYPFLARRFCVDTAPASRGHEALHQAEQQVHLGFQSARAMPPGIPDQALVPALKAHRRLLDEHLQLEEEMVIPLLLALSPAEFGEYYDSSITQLLTRLGERPGGTC